MFNPLNKKLLENIRITLTSMKKTTTTWSAAGATTSAGSDHPDATTRVAT